MLFYLHYLRVTIRYCTVHTKLIFYLFALCTHNNKVRAKLIALLFAQQYVRTHNNKVCAKLIALLFALCMSNINNKVHPELIALVFP